MWEQELLAPFLEEEIGDAQHSYGPASPASPSAAEVPAGLLYSEELVAMSFDAMAQLDLSTGTVLWSNAAFDELTRGVGGGNPAVGLGLLQGSFLKQVPDCLRRMRCTFGSGSSAVDLESASQVVGPNEQRRVLWVLDAASGRSPLSSPENSISKSPSFHKASEWIDPHVQVMCDPMTFAGGKGRRQVQNLWQRYGKKSVVGRGGRVDRLYYRCHREGCQARLKIHAQPETRLTVNAEATGGLHTC